jgi:predicted nucleotidyltransferase
MEREPSGVGYYLGKEDRAVTELIESKRSELRALCERYHVRRLALFGSALREDFDPNHSDLDFCVEFQAMTRHEHAESYFGLLEDLEDLFARRVDLVEIGAVRNPYLRREIEAGQETLYAAA